MYIEKCAPSSSHVRQHHEEIVVSGEDMMVDANEHVQDGFEARAMGMCFSLSGVRLQPCSHSVEQ